MVWDGRILKISLVGQTQIALIDEQGNPVEVALEYFESLVRRGHLSALSEDAACPTDKGLLHPKARNILAGASPEDLNEANRRAQLLQPYLKGQLYDETCPMCERTMQSWKRSYLQAERLFGIGFIGLLSAISRRGNRQPRLSEDTRLLMEEVIQTEYESARHPTILSVYSLFVESCRTAGIAPPCHQTFTLAIQKRPKHEQVSKREGKKAAYVHKPWYWQPDKNTPCHEDRPFELAHIDHTEVDLELRCERTGRILSRPWLTIMIDAYSRRILALWISFDPPSYRACMMVLHVCVCRHGRLPQILITDGSKEFGSVYFQTLLARFEVTREQRPPAQGRFGSICERIFGTNNTQFFYNLTGNTQLTKNVRQLTPAVNPKTHAAWTLERLYERLSVFSYEVYDTTDHPTLLMSPREAFAEGLDRSGHRSHKLIPYNQDFVMLTIPTTERGM